MLGNDRLQQLLLSLGDGRWHSGEALASTLPGEPSRMTVNNYAKQLIEWGYPLERKHGAGYRLATELPVLDADQLQAQLDLPCAVVASTASTNDLAKAWLDTQPSEQAALFVAGHQTQGRGRTGRAWQAKPLTSLLCSIAWRFERYPADLPALSLVVGLSLVEALQPYVEPLAIKWPNDVLLAQRKLAGILIEASIQQEQVSVVIGVGVNLFDAPIDDLRYPAIGLHEKMSRLSPEVLLGDFFKRLEESLPLFAESGFAPFHERYLQHDAVIGREIDLDGRPVDIASIDNTGALVLDDQGQPKRYVSGELSLPWPSC